MGRNGELLRLAEREFDVFLTVDRKLQHQLNLPTFRIAIVVMLARTLAAIHPLGTLSADSTWASPCPSGAAVVSGTP